MSESFEMCKKFLGKKVEVVLDRPLGSEHPELGFVYEANYGYVPDTKAPDGEELDAYYLGVDKPLIKAKGDCVAILHNLNFDDDKLIIIPEGEDISDKEIKDALRFQEDLGFQYEIIRI